jgi:hypothetical protein
MFAWNKIEFVGQFKIETIKHLMENLRLRNEMRIYEREKNTNDVGYFFVVVVVVVT